MESVFYINGLWTNAKESLCNADVSHKNGPAESAHFKALVLWKTIILGVTYK